MPLDPNLRRAQQEQADAESLVAQRNEDQQRQQASQAKQLAREQKAAADAARKAALSSQELAYRAQGMIPVTTADGNLHPDPLWEQKQAEKAAESAKKQQAAQLSDQFTREGRKSFVSQVTGLPTALESDAQLDAQKKAKADAARKAALNERVTALETAATDPTKKRLPQTAREKLAKQLDKTRQEALYGLQATLQEQAKGVSGGTDWIPFNEKPTPEATAAQERLARLSQPDADLTDDDIALLEANDATKPAAQKLRNIQSLLAKDDEASQFHDSQAAAIFDLKMRRDDPAKWQEMQRQRRASLDPEALAADLTASSADFEARQQEFATAYQPIAARRATHEQSIQQLEQQAALRRQSGLMAGEIVTFTRPDGTTEDWPADLAAQYEQQQAIFQAAEAQDTGTLEKLAALQDDLQTEAALLNEGQQTLSAKAQQQADTARSTSSLRLKYTPGAEHLPAQLDTLRTEAETRRAALQAQYPDGIPDAALQALQDDIATRQDQLLTASEALMQDSQAAAAQIHQRIASEFAGKDATPAYNEAADALAAAHGITPQEAHRLLEDAESISQWGITFGKHNEGDTPGKTRLLTNGAIVVNPEITDQAAYAAAIAKSGGTPEAQAEALARYPDIRAAAAQQTLSTIQEVEQTLGTSSLNDWTNWSDWKKQRPADVSEAEWALRWSENNQSKNTGILGTLLSKTKQVIRGLAMGGNDLRSQASGLVAGITGSETAMQDAQWANRKSQAHQSSLALGGHTSDNFLTKGVFDQLPRLASSLLPAAGGARLAQAGLRGFAATGLGARLFPSLAAAVKAASTPAQAAASLHRLTLSLRAGKITAGEAVPWATKASEAVAKSLITPAINAKAITSLTRAGLGGAATAGAAQTYAAQLGDIYSTLRRENPELSHEDALQQSQMPAIVSGMATALLTIGFGATGIERLLVRPREARELVGKAFASRMQQLGFVGSAFAKGGLKESVEEGLDEGISQVAAAVGTGHSVQQAVSDFLRTLPELAVATTLLGGAGEAVSAAQQSSVGPAPSNLPENIATAWSAIEGHVATDAAGNPDTTLTDQQQRRAALALSLAQGGELFDVEAADLAAAGWTRDGDKFKPIKDYAGPQVLDIDAGGLPVVKDTYIAALRQTGLAPVADAIGMTETETRNFYAQRDKQQPAGQNQPGPQQPQSGTAQSPTPNAGGSPTQSSIQTPAGQGTQQAPSGNSSAQSSDAVATPINPVNIVNETPSEAPATPADFLTNHLADRGLPRDQAQSAASQIAERPEFEGMTYEQIIAEGPKFRTAIDDLGITGSLNSKDLATNPLKIAPGSRLEKVKAEMAAKAAAVSQNTASQTPANLPPAVQSALADAIPGVAAPDLFAAVKKAVQEKEMTEQQATSIVAKQTEAKDHSALRQALELHLGWNTLRANTSSALHFGDKSKSPVPLASGKRDTAANRVPVSKSPSLQVSKSGPDISLAADPSPLRKNRAYAADKLRVLAGIKDPAKKAWARQFFTALEQSLQRHHLLYDAYAVGGPARRHLDGQMTAVLEVEGKITRLIDLDAMVAQFDYLQSPQDALRATSIEEDIHAQVLQLARENPAQYGYDALRQKWQQLPDALKQTVWQAYRAANQSTASAAEATMPKLSGVQEWHMMNEFLRMLVQDSAFAGAITESVDTATGLIGWVQDLLRDLSKLLKDLMKKVQPDLRVNLDRMVQEISDRLAQIEQASAAQADRLAVLPSLRDPAAYASLILQQLGSAENAGILSDAALARVFDQLDPELQSRVFNDRPNVESNRADKAVLMRTLLGQFLGSRRDSQRLATALAGMQAPPKTTGLLTKIMDRLLDRVQDAPTLDLLAKQSPQARRDLKNLHIATLRAIGGIRAASFTHSFSAKPALVTALEAPALEVPSESAERRRSDFLAALAAREQDHEDARNDANQSQLRQRLRQEEAANPAIEVIDAEAARIQQRLSDFLAALDDRDRQIELDHRDASTPSAGPALRRKLRQEEFAAAHQIAYMRGEALGEIQQHRDRGRLPETQRRLLFDLLQVASGRFAGQRPADIRLAGFSTEKTLQNLGLRITERGSLVTIDPVNSAAYAERGRIILRQETLDTVADIFPAVAAYLHLRLGSEYDQRQKAGLPTFAKPTPQLTDEETTPVNDVTPVNEVPAPTEPTSPPLAPDQSPFAANTSPSPSLPVSQSQSPVPTARIPLGGRNSLPAQFATAEDLAAFQYQLDRDALLREGTPEKDRTQARDRITALRARLIDETGATKEEVEQKLADYHRAVIDAAKKADPVEVFRPVSFSNFLRARGTQAKADTLVAPEGGDLISALQGRVKRIGKISQSRTAGEWDWYRQLQQQVQAENAGRPLSRRQLQQAQKAAQNGDVSTPLNLLQWINLNVVDADKGMPIDEAATALADTGKLDENDPNAQQPFDVDGTSLGDSILAAIDARVALRDQGGDPALRQEAEALRQGSDFRAVAEGAPGRAFTGSELAARLQPGDEIQLGTEWLTVTDVDADEGTLALDSDRYGPQGIDPTQTIHLLAIGDEQFNPTPPPTLTPPPGSGSPRLSQSTLDAARAELRAALQEAGLAASNRSLVTDADGKPLTLWHATWTPDGQRFEQFTKSNDPSGGFWFSTKDLTKQIGGNVAFQVQLLGEVKEFKGTEMELKRLFKRYGPSTWDTDAPGGIFAVKDTEYGGTSYLVRNADQIIPLAASNRLDTLITSNAGAESVTNLNLTVYRVGPIGPFTEARGVFFADSPESARSYKALHPGHQTTAYNLTSQKAFIARNLHDAWQRLFNKRLDLNEIDIRRKLNSTALAVRWADEQVSKRLRSLGFDAWILTQPAPPAKHEIALIGKTASVSPSPLPPPSQSPSILASSPRIRAAAATYADNVFVVKGKRTFPDFLAYVNEDLPDLFPTLKTPHLRSAWNTLMAEKGLPEITPQEEAAALRALEPKVERRFGEMPPDIAARDAAIDPALLDQIVGITAPPANQTDNAAAAAADLASLGENSATADAPSIFAVPAAPDAPAMPDTPEERMDAGWNAHPEDEQLPSAPLIAKGDLDAAKPVNIQGGKSSLLARGIYNRAIAALARHAAAIGDMFFGTGTVTQYIHKAGLGKPGGHASEYSPWRASFLRQVTDPSKVEALARGARAGITELKRVQEAARDAVTGSADFPAAMKAFAGFINSLDHSAISADAWNTIRKRALSGYQTSLKDKDYSTEEFALKVEHFARVHGLKARVLIGMYQALPESFDLSAYAQRVSAAQAWDKHLLETRSGQTAMFAPAKAEHPGPIPARDDPATTGLYIAAEMLSDNGISLDLDGAGNLNEPFTGLFDDWDWHTSDRAKNIEKLIRDYHTVFAGKTVHSANSWLLLPRLAQENPGIGFVIDPPYFGVPEMENGRVIIDTATGQPVRKGTSNYDSTTDIRTPDDLLRLFDSFVLPAWQSGAKFVLTNEWDDSAAVALRLRGATVVKIARQGRKGDTPELVAYNFNPTDGTLRPHRISAVTPGRAFNALQRGAYPGTSHSGNLDPRLRVAARAAAEAQPEAARMALQQRQNAAQLPRGNATGGSGRPVGADQRSSPRTPALDATLARAPGQPNNALERAQLNRELDADLRAAREFEDNLYATPEIELADLEAEIQDSYERYSGDSDPSETSDPSDEALPASPRLPVSPSQSLVHPATGQPLPAARRQHAGPTFPGLKKPTLPAPQPSPDLFDEWVADVSRYNQREKSPLVGFRGEIAPGRDNGFGNTEGTGIYLMRKAEEAAFFGRIRRVSFPEPQRPFLVTNDDLYLLNEDEDLDQPIDAAKDTPWLQASKYAAQHAHNLGKGKWDAQLAGDILTNLLMEAGYDSVYVKGMPDDWVVLLRETRPGQKPLKSLKASARVLPPKPDLDDYHTFKGTQEERRAQWDKWHSDVDAWNETVDQFAARQGDLGTFLAAETTNSRGGVYREARVITRVPGSSTDWRTTIFGQQRITPTSTPVGDWANNAWVPIAHDEFPTKGEAYQSAVRGMPEDYTFSTKPLFAANRRVEQVEPGFYSALAEAIRAKMPTRSTPATILGILKNAGLKAEEMKWTGIVPWLQAHAQDGPITQQQVLDYLATEGSVQFTITRLNAGSEASDQINRLQERANNDEDLTPEEWNLLLNQPTHSKPQQATRNTQWTLPGGTNPKEVVVTWEQPIPQSKPEEYPKRADLVIETRPEEDDITGEPTGKTEYVARYNGVAVGFGYTEEQAARRGMERTREMFEQRRAPTPPNSPNLDSDTTHYGDLDALAWYRTTDRTNAVGPGLLVEEFQSKWHQEGREKGYKHEVEEWQAFYSTPAGAEVPIGYGDTAEAALANADPSWKGLVEIKTRKTGTLLEGSVPDAPYRTAWPLMLFKRALLDAVQAGKSWIGWTTGDTQADRYDLSKHVDSMFVTKTNADGDTYVVHGLKNKLIVIQKHDVPSSELSALVGKELAERIKNEVTTSAPKDATDYSAWKEFTGLDLRVGGQGMRKFYDDMLVKEFGKYVKQLGGGTVESSSITAKQRATSDAQPQGTPIGVVRMQPGTWGIEFPNGVFGQYPSQQRAQIRLQDELDNPTTPPVSQPPSLPVSETPIHLIRITPQMRDAVSAGQALFSANRTNPSQITAIRAIFPHANDPSQWTHATLSSESPDDLRQRQSLADDFGGGTAARPNRAYSEERIASDQKDQRAALGSLAQRPQSADQFGSLLDHGGEHAVYVSPDARFVTKITLPGFYGYVPTEDIAPGISGDLRRLKLRQATPAEYLLRAALFSELTGLDWQVHGLELNDEATDAPVIISTQPYVRSAVGSDGNPLLVTQPQIDAYMASIGFSPLEDTTGTTYRDEHMEGMTYWHPQRQIIAADARPANFRLTPDQHVVPVDLMLAHYPLASSFRTPTQAVEATGLAPAISVNGIPYTGRTGMFHGGILGNYVWKKVFTPQQRRDDPNQDNAVNFAHETWMDSRGSGFDDFGFLDTRSGKFLTREEAYTLLTERGFTPPPDSYSIRHQSLDSSDLFNSTPTLAASNRLSSIVYSPSPSLPVSKSPPLATQVAAAAAATDPNPSDAQKRAGNYAKGKLTLHGLRISIENPSGSTRSGTDANGKPWSVTLPHHYGYILGTEGRDGDHVDVFIGPNPDSHLVLIVNQRKPGNGHFDEHKVMLGFNTPAEAARGYMASYSPGWKGLQSAIPTTLPVFTHWLTTKDTTQPVTKEQIEKLAKTLPLPTSAHDKPAVSIDTTTKPKPAHPPVTHTLPDGYHLTAPGLHALPASIRAHHGTPHKIDLKTGFSTSKIGSGEGAQAYGWGLYFAESMGLADKYRLHLTTPALIIGDKEFTRREGADAFAEWAANQLPKDWPPYAVSRFKEVLNRFHYDVTSFVAHPDEAADDAKKVFEKFLREFEVSDATLQQAIGALAKVVDIAEAPSPQDTTEGRWYARAIGWRPHRTSRSIETAAYYDMFSRIGWYASTFADAPARLRKEYRQTINAQQQELDRLLDLEKRPATDPAVNDATKRIDLAETALDLIDSGKVKLVANPRRGNFYTVDLLGDPEQFLNWDADLRDHPADIRQKFMDALGHVLAYQVVDGRDPEYSRFMTDKTRPWQLLDAMGDATGHNGATRKEADERRQELDDGWQWQNISDIYKIASAEGDMTPQKASEALAKAGIPGIRYLDGSSRTAGKGTHNYVIFDDKLVKIIAENGQPNENALLFASNRLGTAKTLPLPTSAHDKPAVNPVNPVTPVPLASSQRQPDAGITNPTDAAFVRARVAEWQDAVAAADAFALEAIDLRKKREVADEAFRKAPPEEKDARRAEALQLFDAEWEAKKKADRAPRAIQGLYIRFGIPPVSGRSQNFITSTPDRPRYEKGISTFPITWENGRWQFSISDGTEPSLDALIGRHDRHIYLVTGTVVDEGEDNEPVLGTDYRVIKELSPTEILPPGYVNDASEWDQSDEVKEWQPLFASNRLGTAITRSASAVATGTERTLQVANHLTESLGWQQPLATFGSNNLDKRLAAQLDKLAGPKVRSAKAAVETWLDKPEGLAPTIKGLVDQVLPNALIPREWLALHHEMQRKSAFGQETANDLIRAISGNPRLSDLAYPKEFAENPAARAQLFDAMEGRIPMSTLPPEMQRLGQRLRDLLRQTGSELVRQGLMNPDTFEELQSNGWMPRYTEDEARESAGSFLAAFKLGVRDLLQQRSTAYHIVDTTRKDKTGQFVTVSRDEGGKRNRWRFRDAASRDAFYHDFVRQQTLSMLQESGNKIMADMLAPLSRGDKAAMRSQIKTLTADQIANTAKLSPMLAGIVKQAKKHQYDRFAPKDPFEPAKLIKDPVYAVARYTLGQTHNASTMELLRKTSANPEWVSDVAITGFEAIPDASRFGPLAGKHVRKDIAAQILDLVDVPNAALQFYDSILRKWKAGKLVWNPGSHVRDAVGNTMFAYLGGSSIWNPGNWPHYQQAIAALRNGGTGFAELVEMQVIGGDAYTNLVKDRLKGLLPDPKTVENYDPGFVQRMMFGFGATLHGSHEFMSSLRRLPDDLFKAAAYFKAKADTTSDLSPLTSDEIKLRAAEHVRKWFPYYDRLGQSGTTRAVGRFVNPFVSFFRESTRILGTAVVERPLALTAALSFPAMITALSAMALGLDDDDMEEIKKDMAGKGKLFATDTSLFSMLLPFRSSQGAVQQFDISAVMPFADLLGTKIAGTDATEDPWNRFWRGIVSGGPVLSLIDAWRHNEDAFTRRPIAEFGMTPLEKITAYGKHAAGVALPPLAPGGTAFSTLLRAGDRSTNKTLERYDPAQAVVRSVVGLNVKNATPDLYRLADDWRKAHGYEVTEGMDYGSTTPASRARKALFGVLAQDEPNPTALKNILNALDKMGHPVRTEQDVNRLLFYRDPLKLIGGNKARGITASDAQAQFRASLQGEARAALERSLAEYQRIKAKAPSLIRAAQ